HSDSWPGELMLWDLTTRPFVNTHLGHHEPALHVAFSPGGKLLASSRLDPTIRLWEVPSGRLLDSLEEEGAVGEVAFSPDGRTLAIAMRPNPVIRRPGVIKLWDVATRRVRAVLKGHQGGSRAVAFS